MSDRELEQRAQRRLAVLRHVEEVSGNVAATCRYHGISRQCYYGWLRRFEAPTAWTVRRYHRRHLRACQPRRITKSIRQMK